MDDQLQTQPFVNSTPVLNDAGALREHMDRDGYLFFRTLVSADDVGTVYEDIAEICRKHGWMDEEGNAIGEPNVEGSEPWGPVYDDLQRLQSFHALAHHPRIVGVIESLVQEQVLVHPRNIARITYPRAEYFTTPAHQDFVHIQGTPVTYTVWMPLSDCPISLGGLAVLAGSHKLGILPAHQAPGAGGLGIDTSKLDYPWHTDDMQAGDTLIFHSFAVHRALPNLSGNRFRISTDTRYQGVSQPIVEDGLLPHYGRLTWDQIYEGWDREDLQYYWKRMDINPVPRDPSVREKVLAAGKQ
jgi:ectoine hydroxylase-related dioxygenase (phytanoyl-CoA dioxygenase family)